MENHFKTVPWSKHYWAIKSRCKYGKYGQNGIKHFITKKQIKQLWFRDKAYLMEQPSIDRIDTYGDYTFDNCRFIENRENKNRLRAKSKTVKNRFKGVFWQQDHKKYRVRVFKDKKDIHIGYFSNEEEAAKIYNSIVSKLFEKDTVLNNV